VRRRQRGDVLTDLRQSTGPLCPTPSTYLFSEVVDGRNAETTDGVRRALGREARDFADYAQETAASGVWNASAVTA
jgi:hypothetical protein